MEGIELNNRKIRILTFAPVLALAACSTVGPPMPGPTSATVDTRVYDIDCQEAHRIAARTIRVRGLEITEVNRGPSGGTVRGKNEKEEIEVQVVCGAGGVTVEPSGGHWLQQGIKMSFASFVDAGDRIWPPPKGPKILVEELPGAEAKLEFPQTLEPLGMTAVRFRVINGGAREIRIEPRRIQGRSEAGSTVAAISAQGVKAKLASVDPAIDSKILGTTTLKQGDEVRGFVFLPAGRYSSVLVKLVDVPTGEADEFEIFLHKGS